MKGRLVGAALLLAAALAIAGCGGGGSPEDTVNEFVQAAQDSDGEAACELLTTASQELIALSGEDCATVFESDSAPADIPEDFEIGETTEEGDTATVQVTGDGEETEIPLTKEDDEWRIDFASAAGGAAVE